MIAVRKNIETTKGNAIYNVIIIIIIIRKWTNIHIEKQTNSQKEHQISFKERSEQCKNQLEIKPKKKVYFTKAQKL